MTARGGWKPRNAHVGRQGGNRKSGSFPPALKKRRRLQKAAATKGNALRGRDGARKRTRTSTTVRPLAPEASASASSAIRAQGKTTGRSYFGGGKVVCQRRTAPDFGSLCDCPANQVLTEFCSSQQH